MKALLAPRRTRPTATLAAAPPGALTKAGASASPLPVTVGTKSIRRSPKQTTSVMTTLIRERSLGVVNPQASTVPAREAIPAREPRSRRNPIGLRGPSAHPVATVAVESSGAEVVGVGRGEERGGADHAFG